MAFLTAFAASVTLAFFLRGSRAKPTRWGGLAVLAGLVFSVAVWYGPPAFFTLRVFWLALGILFLMGVADDLFVLSPLTKLGFQILAAALFLFLTPPGVWGGEVHRAFGPWALPVLLVWLVGVTNALNLLDNMDGLAAGVGLAAALGFAWLGLGAGSGLVPLAGALAGFLVFNLPPARLYLGDAGSHLVGFSVAVLPLYGQPPGSLWVPALVLLAPIADTSFVTVVRLLRGRSPFQGGKDHLSHGLHARGTPPLAVAALFTLATAGLVAAAAILWRF